MVWWLWRKFWFSHHWIFQNHSDGRLQEERGGRLGYRVNAGLRFCAAIVVAKTIILRVFLLGLKMDPGIEELSFTVWVMVTISVYLELIKKKKLILYSFRFA